MRPSARAVRGGAGPVPALVPGLDPPPRAGWGWQPDGSWRHRGTGLEGRPLDRNPGAVERIPVDERPERPRTKAVGVAYAVAWEVVRRLPERLAFGAADLGARVVAARRGGPGSRIRRNLATVVAPEALDRAVVAAFRSYARYYVEAFRAADIDPASVDARTTTGGFEHLDAVLDEGRGAIVLLAHHGSWDMAARWAESHGYHLACVAEVLRPRRLFARFVALREAIGLEIVPLRRGADLVGRLQDVLEEDHLVGLLADRDLTGKAPVVELFGRPARVPIGPALLSLRTGVPIVPITMLHRPGLRWHVQVLEPISVVGLPLRDACQRVARGIEELIRLDPPQWHAFQRVFEDDEAADEGAGGAAGAGGAPPPRRGAAGVVRSEQRSAAGSAVTDEPAEERRGAATP